MILVMNANGQVGYYGPERNNGLVCTREFEKKSLNDLIGKNGNICV